MKRTLVDRSTNKTWSIQLQDTSITIISNGAKPKNKKFKTCDDAMEYAKKESWKLLKKGYTFHDANAEKLQCALHIYIGKGFTGYMPIAPIGDTNAFYIAYVLGEFDQENIYQIDDQGNIQLINELPPPSLTFNMAFMPELGRLFINANHHILQIDPQSRQLSRLSSEKDQFVSIFSVSDTRIAWVDGLMLRVTDRAKELVLLQKKLNIEPHKAHLYDVCGGLSKDGKWLAYHLTGEKKIALVNIETGEETFITKDAPAITRKIYFSADNKTLFIQEAEDSWQVKYYNLEENDGWCRFADSGEDTVLESAIDQQHNKLAVATRGLVKVYNMHTKNELFQLEPENTMKYCNIAFLKDYLAVYTDSGCVSLYKI